MYKFWVIIMAGFFTVGCRSIDSNVAFFHAAGWDNAKDAKFHLDAYQHVLLVCIYEDHWEDRGPHKLSLHHFKATIVKTYKGDLRVSEKIAFVHGVDAPPLTTSNGFSGTLMFVFTNEHTNAELSLDTGDFVDYDPEIERALRCVLSQQKRG